MSLCLAAAAAIPFLLQAAAVSARSSEPSARLAPAFARLAAAGSDVVRFTYMEKLRIVAVNEQGKTLSNMTRRYQVTWINNLPYMHLVEENDKPLEGRALRREQKRYDDAVAGKKQLGESERGKTDGFRTLLSLRMDPDLVLGPLYQLKALYQEVSAGIATDVIEADPRPGAALQTTCRWRYQFWVTADDPYIARVIADVSGDVDESCQGTHLEVTYELVGGIPKPEFLTVRFNAPRHHGSGHIENYVAYSDYRRFQTTVTLLPGSMVDTPPATAPPDHP